MSSKFKPKYKRIAQLKTAKDFNEYLESIKVNLPFDKDLITGVDAPYEKSWVLKSGRTIGNRLCILPMEGWDGTADGRPTDYTKRRWKNFAISGAKLLWGCEAVAVCHDGKANPNQLHIKASNLSDFKDLFQLIIHEHQNEFDRTDDLVIGLQLTHSGRFSKPNNKTSREPKIVYKHPILDTKFGIDALYPVLTDEDIDRIIQDYIKAAKLAQKAGFHFVDIKHCHGYLGHEFLSAKDRKGKYGGSLENRTLFLRSIVKGIHKEAPGLEIAVRLSAFDWIPFKKGENGIGVPENKHTNYEYAFGGDGSGVAENKKEIFDFLAIVQSLGIELICITVGSPYYNPHIQRPALFPPSDGYQPPEDPLVGVARQIEITAEIKRAFPELAIVGSAYSYLQEWLPNVGQSVLKQNLADFIGLGRMVLSYPDMPTDILKGEVMLRKKICRTFSDCTTGPRNGLISGCYPLDPFYKVLPEAKELKVLKKLAK
jgi:2,4-dienoyl-CoA reductase-like NADH-dependent reductase (Old Yellow Enzyme family)|tara:strand:- start:1283 stop:2734 length:1452 start_codon:yes stop_codon:yes gene_type:complete